MRPPLSIPLLIAAASLAAASDASADVVVVANRLAAPIEFHVRRGDATRSYQLAAGDVVPLPTAGPLQLAYRAGEEPVPYTLDPGCAYFFQLDQAGRPDLHRIELGKEPIPAAAGKLPQGIGTLPIKLLVDDDEPAARRLWESRLRKRVEAASAVLEKYCHLRLKITEVAEWESDDDIEDFAALQQEFEKNVDAAPARVAIGFSSQLRGGRSSIPLGGTRGPLHSHILLCEASRRMGEPERVELLVHSLGHFLGAVHSPEPTSVMRPMGYDRQALAGDFRIGFDPLNALATYLVAEEIRGGGGRNIEELSQTTKKRIQRVYAELEKALPSGSGSIDRIESAAAATLAEAAGRVVLAIGLIAQRNASLPAGGGRRQGDALMEAYVRQAAWTAHELPDDLEVPAFLLGLGIALDSADVLMKYPQTRLLVEAVERPEARAARRRMMGQPTLRGRHDLAQHFAVSACLVEAVGPQLAEAAGVAKEMLDAQGTSGFSFADLAADRAGVIFARAIQTRRFRLMHLAGEYRTVHFLPSVDGLPEGLAQAEFAERFGGPTDERYRRMVDDITARIRALPPYRVLDARPEPLAPP